MWVVSITGSTEQSNLCYSQLHEVKIRHSSPKPTFEGRGGGRGGVGGGGFIIDTLSPTGCGSTEKKVDDA